MAINQKEIVLITGANTGLGLECVRKLVRDHGDRFHVLIGSRSLSKGEAAAKSLHEEGHEGVEAVQLDVTDEASLTAAAKTVEEKFGRLDVLHVNAGIALELDYPDRTKTPLSELIMMTMKTNVAGAAATVDHFTALLDKAENPRVVFMSTGGSSFTLLHDRAAHMAVEWPAYCTSKAALNMLMLHYYHTHKGWKVNACSPGFRATNLNHFGQGGGGHQPGPIEEGAINAVRLMLLDKDGETGTHTMLQGKDGYATVPW